MGTLFYNKIIIVFISWGFFFFFFWVMLHSMFFISRWSWSLYIYIFLCIFTIKIEFYPQMVLLMSSLYLVFWKPLYIYCLNWIRCLKCFSKCCLADSLDLPRLCPSFCFFRMVCFNTPWTLKIFKIKVTRGYEVTL